MVVLAGVAHAEPFARFFVMGDGRLALENAHTGERADVQYRRADGTYDDAAVARLRRVFRSRGDKDARMSLRLVELLSRLQQDAGVKSLRVLSGYRSPTYNEGLRKKGVRAAGGSLHTEGLAADIAFPRPKLRDLWMALRARECCGAGFYDKEGFMHVDVGRPRFWEPATSRVEENLSAGNARLFARTEFDRYRVGEPIVLSLHALTLPPVCVVREAWFTRDGEERMPVTLDGADTCVSVDTSSATLRLPAAAVPGRGKLVLSTCEPRVEATPATVETQAVEVR